MATKNNKSNNSKSPKKKRGGGRKHVVFDYQKVQKYASIGLYKHQIAHNLGIHKSTFFSAMKRDPKLAEAWTVGKNTGIAIVANALFESAVRRKNVAAQIFYLRVIGKWKEPQSKKDDKGDRSPIPVQIIQSIPDNGRENPAD